MNCWKKEETMEWITLEKIKKLKSFKYFFFPENNLRTKQTLENTEKCFVKIISKMQLHTVKYFLEIILQQNKHTLNLGPNLPKNTSL